MFKQNVINIIIKKFSGVGMKNSKKNTKKYIQTDIFSFCNEFRNEKISSIVQNSFQNDQFSQLKKTIRLRYIKKEYFNFDEWQRTLGKDWQPFENNKYFISNDHCMVSGNLLDYENLMKTKKISDTFQFLNEIHNLNEISNLKVKKDNIEIVQFNKFYYTFNIFKKSYHILEKPIIIHQNEHGLLVCKNHNAFILIAPIII